MPSRRCAWPPTTVASSSPECTGRLHIDETSWQLTFDGAPLASGVAAPPVVSGFYTQIDPNGAGAVRAELVTQPFGSRPSTRQWILHASTVVFALLALGALWLQRPASSNPLVRPRRRTEDVVVVATLGFWWLAGPWFFDDGWLMATVRAHRVSGSFNNYFDTFAAQMPLGFAHHMLLSPFAKTDAPFLVWRAVPLAACVATWFLLRVIHATVAGHEGPRRGTVALAGAFTIFAIAWLMTLRPEPIVALLSAVVGVALLDHVRTRSSLSLAAAVIAAAVASTLHPSGLVACAPLVIALPSLARTARRSMAGTASIATGRSTGSRCRGDVSVRRYRCRAVEAQSQPVRERRLPLERCARREHPLPRPVQVRHDPGDRHSAVQRAGTGLLRGALVAPIRSVVHPRRQRGVVIDRRRRIPHDHAQQVDLSLRLGGCDRVDGHRGRVRTGGHDERRPLVGASALDPDRPPGRASSQRKGRRAVLHEAGHTTRLRLSQRPS